MPVAANGPSPLDILRERVIALAGMRFEKFYHRSTGTHIVRQAEGTEFHACSIKGYGNFADEAYASYRSALAAYITQQSESRLRDLETLLSNFAPVGQRKVELQVQLPEDLAEHLERRAKEAKVSLGAFVNQLLDQLLPYDFDDARVAAWSRSFVRRDHDVEQAKSARRQLLTVPVAAQEFERLERMTVRLAATEGDATFNEVVFRMLAHEGNLSSQVSPTLQ